MSDSARNVLSKYFLLMSVFVGISTLVRNAAAQEEPEDLRGVWAGTGSIDLVEGIPGPNDGLADWDGSVEEWQAHADFREGLSNVPTGIRYDNDGFLDDVTYAVDTYSLPIGPGPVRFRIKLRSDSYVIMDCSMGRGLFSWAGIGIKVGKNLVISYHSSFDFDSNFRQDRNLNLNVTLVGDDTLLGYWWYFPSHTTRSPNLVPTDMRWSLAGRVELHRESGPSD